VNTAALNAANVGWVDWSLLAVVVLSVVVGLMRGLVFELMSAAGWVVAYFAAQWFTPQWSSYVPFAVPIGSPGSALNHAATFGLTFIAFLLVWSIASKLIRMMVRSVPGVSAADRLMGGVFGLVRAVVLMLAVATVVGLTPLAASAAWQKSHASIWTQDLLLGLKGVLPADFFERFSKVVKPA
jgi:membrane protein required for colicin V production